MPDYSRRQFLSYIGAASLLFLSDRHALSFRVADDYEMLVVGDSLISGQGLREKDKFYYLTKEWLQNDVFGKTRKVRLRNLSHSGSNIFLNEEEKKAMQDAGRSAERSYHQEVNFSFPSIQKQIEFAVKEYTANGVAPDGVDLVMVTGGITNIAVKNIINPFSDSDKLRRKIKKYCNAQMLRFLKETNSLFPNALIAVIGYYPMISPKSSTGMIYNAVLELYDLPGPLKPVMNNILTKQGFKILHRKMTKRSRIWARESERELQNAVAAFNESFTAERAVFVKSPINESNCFGTKKTLLWKMAKKGRSEDDLYDVRRAECTKAIGEFKDVKLDFKTRFCELSGLGHPNVEGSKAYADAIKKVLHTKVGAAVSRISRS